MRRGKILHASTSLSVRGLHVGDSPSNKRAHRVPTRGLELIERVEEIGTHAIEGCLALLCGIRNSMNLLHLSACLLHETDVDRQDRVHQQACDVESSLITESIPMK